MKLFVRQLVNPLLSKIGTGLGLFLVGNSVNAETTEQIVTGFIAAGLVGVDLLIDKIRDRTQKKGNK